MADDELEELRQELRRKTAELEAARNEIAHMKASKFWKLRDAWWDVKLRVMRHPAPAERPPVTPSANATVAATPAAAAPRENAAAPPQVVEILVYLSAGPVEIEACVNAVLRYSHAPYTLTLVDDARPEPVRAFAERIARTQGARHFRSKETLGYAGAMNRAISESAAATLILLDGTALVTPGWLERLLAAAASNSRSGLAVPITAPAGGLTPAAVSALAVRASARLRPICEGGGDGCLLMKRHALDAVGPFDEIFRDSAAAAAADLSRRARGAGFGVVLADDVVLTREAEAPGTDDAGRAAGDPDRVVAGIAARLEAGRERRRLRSSARERWEGKRVLFLLPITERGGGANVVLSEARAMIAMGVDARVWNRTEFRSFFEKAYPALDVPLITSAVEDLALSVPRFDAVVATVNTSVAWLSPLAAAAKPPVLGYYVQDFEPYFYEPGSQDQRRALASYSLLPGLKTFTKTRWNRDEVKRHTGVDCHVIGPSLDVDLFRPRRPELPAEPMRIAAMIRPSTPRRQPAFTLEVLARVAREMGPRVAITLFGVEASDPAFLALDSSFPHRHAGVPDGAGLADLFNSIHVFADFSSFQAMGLVAMEAMACGATAVVPEAGGSGSFAIHEGNALVVDTSSADLCTAALLRLGNDRPLRDRLRRSATTGVVRFAPETAAHSILGTLFPC
jgi:glycosyltransferase involved in cell wall biosynthesis